uniref:Uncharacterized protein n=1 Tax=Tetraselmis chuii TaxID=63592 RepID=A0A7S1T0N4_9CHLO|mmetsp:Transcript_37755/g.67673  ORF Transcript_37755/g.67673 Transcript_37755/m.67673 type:complete len:168 (+) Transcript_37755:269-772(+)
MGLPAPEEVFPLVVPTEPDLSGYAGPVTLPGRDSADPPYLWLSLRSIPVGSPTMRGSVLQCNKALSVLLAGQDGVVLRRLNSSPRVAAFFQELQAILQRQLGSCAIGTVPPDPAFYRTVLDQVKVLGWGVVKHVSPDFQTIIFKVTDAGERVHLVSCKLSPDYPQRA